MWSQFANRTIYLDANIVIYAIERNHSWSQSTKSLLDAIDRRLLGAITSELVVAEVLAKPLAVKDHDLLRKYQHLFDIDNGLKLVPIDRDVLFVAARLQGALRLKLFDAIHLATAQLSGCEYFLTEDDRLGQAIAGDLQWLKLSEIN